MIFAVLRAIKGRSSVDVAKGTYVAASTIQKWRTNQTRYPQCHTLAAVAATAGLEFALVPTGASKEIHADTIGIANPETDKSLVVDIDVKADDKKNKPTKSGGDISKVVAHKATTSRKPSAGARRP
jgi:hypothetical protein